MKILILGSGGIGGFFGGYLAEIGADVTFLVMRVIINWRTMSHHQPSWLLKKNSKIITLTTILTCAPIRMEGMNHYQKV